MSGASPATEQGPQPMRGGPFYMIEKGVPIPPPEARGRPPGRTPAGVWASMEVGDSALFPSQAKVRVALLWGALHGRRFRQLKVRGGWRVWRVA